MNSGASIACATRRVGGDQKGSDSFSACRRTSKNEPANANTAAPAQLPMKPRVESILKNHPSTPPATPTIPVKIIMGASARRYNAERSINVRMTWRCSVAQFESMNQTLYHKVHTVKGNKQRT